METMRIRKGEKIIHLIDFNELVDEVLNSLAFVNGYKELKFIKNISIRQKFYSDKLLIISVFQNLIDNAIKYRRNITDSFIEIFVADEGHGVKIKISDNGIGIPDDLQKEVYKMFFRATNQASGSGLGRKPGAFDHCSTSQPRFRARLASLVSGFTATGKPTTSSMGRSLEESA